MAIIDTEAYTISWGNKDRSILIAKPKRTLTWDEYRKGTTKLHQIIRSAPHKVHIVYALHGIEPLPPGNATTQFKQSIAEQPPNCGVQVIVGASPITITTVQVFLFAVGQFMARLVQFAETIEEAYAIIEQSMNGRQANTCG